MDFARRIGANRVVIALSLARMGDAVGNSILFIVLPLYVNQLAAPLFPFPETVRVGLLIGVFGIVTSILQPVMGSIVDRVGRRKLSIQVGLVLMGAATLSFALAHQFTSLLILRMLQGIGVALTVPASLAIMTTASEKETRGGSMGIFSSMRIIGFAAGPLLGGYLVDRFSFSAAFVAGAVAILIAVVLVQLWIRETPLDLSEQQAKPFKPVDLSILTPSLFGVSFATFAMAVTIAIMVTLETQFNQRLSIAATAFSIAFSALLVSRLLFQIPLGRWSDRIGRKPLIVAGLLLLIPPTAMLGLVTSLPQLIALRLVQGIGSAAVAAPAFALAGDTAPPGSEGRQMSFVTMGFLLGSAVGPLLAGVLAIWSFQLPFYIGGGLALLGAVVAWRMVVDSVEHHRLTHAPVEALREGGED
ncbi:MAG: MFS transporter [Chloroflexota bacterium]